MFGLFNILFSLFQIALNEDPVPDADELAHMERKFAVIQSVNLAKTSEGVDVVYDPNGSKQVKRSSTAMKNQENNIGSVLQLQKKAVKRKQMKSRDRIQGTDGTNTLAKVHPTEEGQGAKKLEGNFLLKRELPASLEDITKDIVNQADQFESDYVMRKRKIEKLQQKEFEELWNKKM